MTEKVAPEGTAQPRRSSRRSSLSEIADEGIRAAGASRRSSFAGRRISTVAAMPKPKPLGCGIKSAYSLPRLVLSGFDYTIRPARVTVYREAFGMPIMTMSMLVSICKSFDFLLGFLVGKLSDSTRTRWGRRKPWIAAFSPLFIVATLLLASPGLFFSSTAKATGANTCANHATKGSLNCTALKQCLDIEIAAGSLPAWSSAGSTDDSASASSYSTGLAVYFATLYFMHYVFGWTASMIPYDALGMELTVDYDDKTSLFGTKVHCAVHCTVHSAVHRPLLLQNALCIDHFSRPPLRHQGLRPSLRPSLRPACALAPALASASVSAPTLAPPPAPALASAPAPVSPSPPPTTLALTSTLALTLRLALTFPPRALWHQGGFPVHWVHPTRRGRVRLLLHGA